MTQEQIHQLFKQGYHQANWKQFLGETFTNARLLATPEILTGIDNNVAGKALKLGYITLDENGIERQIAVYEVALAKGIILERNRVGLRNLLRKYWKNIDAAFIVYHNPENNKWRFTYVSELTGFDADGNFQKIQTEPKRYTYVLGEGESTRTAAERFALIAKKANKATLDDVKDAFSVEKLSKAFFNEYKQHYDIFCNYMMKQPGIKAGIFNGDEKAIRDFNKKLLGRIVFLYFIQKKGWMGVPVGSKWGQGDFNFLTNLFSQHKNPNLFYSEMLTRLFFDTLNSKRKDDIIELVKGQPCRIPYLNGGLFEEDDKKQRNITLDAQLFQSLFDFFNQYNFTIYEDDPNDHTVAVDPEMLGHIFENLLEDNKDKGAFYTPKEIVHYMCQESLIEYLCTTLKIKDENAERTAIQNFLKKKEIDNVLKPEIKNINKALDNVKICDPAIGSGAFPMGLLQEIFTAKQTLWHFEHGNLKDFPASDVKHNIIQNSIYGVDIEKGAVDIARLRFWLSLVVDEEAPKALPNLDYKIVVGNSLVSKLGDDIIDIDWNLSETSHGLFGADLAKQKSELLKKISAEQKEFFNPDSDKKKLAADIRQLKIDLLINQLELMVTTKGLETKPTGTGKQLAQRTELYLQTLGWKDRIKQLQQLKKKPEQPLHFFDWKLDFPEVLNEQINPHAGFDIVIGNPPYVQLQKMGTAADELKSANYQTFQRTGDIYILFFEQGFNLLKERGNLIYITGSAWLRSNYGKSLRKFFSENTNGKILIDLSDAEVFESATVLTTIHLFSKEENKQQLKALRLTKKNQSIIKTLTPSFDELHTVIKNLDENAWVIADTDKQLIRSKVISQGSKLKDWNIEINYGIKTGLNEAFVIDETKRKQLIKEDAKSAEIIKPLLRGRDLGRYNFTNPNLYIIGTFPTKEIDIKKYSAIEKHLKSFGKEKLEQSGEVGSRKKTGNKWYETQDQINYWQNFEKPKILYPNMVKDISFTYDEEGYYVNDKCFILSGENLKYLLAILNSKLFRYCFEDDFPELQGNSREIKLFVMKELHVKHPNKKIQKSYEALTNKILKLKKEDKDTTALEQQIDNLVYRLYELTYDEVKVIDPDFPLSKKEYESIALE